MLRRFSYDFNELSVTKSDLEECIGIGCDLNSFPGQPEEALKSAADICQIQGGYRIFETIGKDYKERQLIAGEHYLKTGRLIFGQLAESDGLLVFVCTAGEAISAYAGKLMDKGDTLRGYLYDVIGSVCVEKALDKMEKELDAQMRKRSLGLTRRFSPGYCGWDVAGQQKLFSLLPEGFCGISLTSSSLMKPIKSVSGVMGFGSKVVKQERPCSICGKRDCIYYERNSPIKH